MLSIVRNLQALPLKVSFIFTKNKHIPAIS